MKLPVLVQTKTGGTVVVTDWIEMKRCWVGYGPGFSGTLYWNEYGQTLSAGRRRMTLRYQITDECMAKLRSMCPIKYESSSAFADRKKSSFFREFRYFMGQCGLPMREAAQVLGMEESGAEDFLHGKGGLMTGDQLKFFQGLFPSGVYEFLSEALEHAGRGREVLVKELVGEAQ